MQIPFGQPSISFSTVCREPAQAFEQAEESPILVLYRNKPVGYIVSPAWMHRMFDELADLAITSKACSRESDVQTKSTTIRRIQLDDL